MNAVRTRFAPSPTGYMHIGNLRTALYAWLLARHSGGDFLLRIEDTDRARLVGDAVAVIYDSLRVSGLDWDEGPDKGGTVGPYVQSERLGIYKEYAEKLLASGHAYRCFCGKEEKAVAGEGDDEEAESASYAYDGRCSRLSEEEIRANLEAGKPFAIRQRVPKEGVTSYHDEVYGDISIENKQLDDQVLLKADGFPTYNFANVVDDHLMGISHVLRGSEYLPSTPKYILLYKAFGWEAPVHVHLPLILGPSGKKLSKREGSVALSDFLERGFLPQAVVNYIALLGWSPGDDTEYMTMDDLVRRFESSRINKSPAVFDEVKLTFFNALHIKALSPEAFHGLALKRYPPEIKAKFDTAYISSLIQGRVEVLSQIPRMLGFLLELPAYGKELYDHKKMKTTPESSLPVLKDMVGLLGGLASWEAQALQDAMLGYAADKGIKNGQAMWPVRVALSGLPSTPGGATEIAVLLGKEETLERIRKGIELLGG